MYNFLTLPHSLINNHSFHFNVFTILFSMRRVMFELRLDVFLRMLKKNVFLDSQLTGLLLITITNAATDIFFFGCCN